MPIQNARPVKKVIESVVGLFSGRMSRHYIPDALSYQALDDIVILPTGFRALDKALDIGGLPYGKITELVHSDSIGNSRGPTSIAARIASNAQRKQQIITIIDMNRGFDPWQASQCGLIASHLLLTRPNTLFEMLATMENAAHHEGLTIVVMGVVAELLNHANPELLRIFSNRIRNIVEHSNTVFLFLTSIQNKNPFTLLNYPPGFSLAELAEVRLWIQEETWTHRGSIPTAYKANLTVIKNRLAIAGKGADIKIKFSAPNNI